MSGIDDVTPRRVAPADPPGPPTLEALAERVRALEEWRSQLSEPTSAMADPPAKRLPPPE